jgi:hypothetical protein
VDLIHINYFRESIQSVNRVGIATWQAERFVV